MKLFDGKVVVITGAGRGIGRAHTLGFSQEGAKIVVNDLGTSLDGSGSTTSIADHVVEEIITQGGEAIANYENVVSMEGGIKIIKSAKWQLPDKILFVEKILKTSVGKIDKKAIRSEYQDI